MMLAILSALPGLLTTSAVLFFSTGDPQFNTSPPTGTLAGSGWELQGKWGISLATPIGPRHFLSVQHLGGSPGDRFEYRGVEYVTAESFDDPESDLRIWKIRGKFQSDATLYRGSNEVGRNVVVHGRGTQRGTPLFATNGVGALQKGWLWGEVDYRQRWGENQVEQIVDFSALPGQGPPIGPLLRMPFNAQGGSNEAHLSFGDSGGGLFLRDGVEWKLAGVNHSVDGPYNTSNSGEGFNAAVFDERGLYKRGETDWGMVANSPASIPSAFYSIRVSARASWIDSILSLPSSGEAPTLQSSTDLRGSFVDEPSAVVNEEERRITMGLSPGPRFFRLRGRYAFRITRITIAANELVISYE